MNKVLTGILILLSAHVGFSQTPSVKLSLKIDDISQDIAGKFKLYLVADKDTIQPVLFTNGFIVPQEVYKRKNAAVCFTYKGDKLFFDSIDTSKFSTDWSIFIDKKNRPKDLKSSYGIRFLTNEGDPTQVKVTIKKS